MSVIYIDDRTPLLHSENPSVEENDIEEEVRSFSPSRSSLSLGLLGSISSLLGISDSESRFSLFDDENGVVVIILYKRRWVVLLLFSALTFWNAASWITFSPIVEIVKETYDVSDFTIICLSMIFMTMYIPFVPVSTWVLHHKGLRWGTMIGALLNALGGWIRFLGAETKIFPVIFAGQTFHAIAQAFILGIPPFLSSTWFGVSERGKATSFGVLANQAGVGVGFILSPMFIKSGRDFSPFLLFEAICCTSVLVLMLFFFYDSPPSPPSNTSAQNLDSSSSPETKNSYLTNVKILACDRSFIFLLLSYGIAVGMFYSTSALIDQFLSGRFPGHFTDFGWIGFANIMAGILGTIIIGYLLDKTKKYHLLTKGVYTFCGPAMAFYAISFLYLPMPYIYLSSTILGFFLTSLIPTGFELAAEITFPVSESLSAGLLNLICNFLGITFTAVAGWLMRQYSVAVAMYFLFGSVCVGIVMVYFVKGEALRHLADLAAHNHIEDENVVIFEEGMDEPDSDEDLVNQQLFN